MPITISIADVSGQPIEGIRVYVKVEDGKEGFINQLTNDKGQVSGSFEYTRETSLLVRARNPAYTSVELEKIPVLDRTPLRITLPMQLGWHYK
ncbi:MAG: hypothetical protein F6K62_17580 [Sphaerospermopsis sp. SIO1G2]|nr:hypothetical protein [Sphaerospermopsis sp. SIO1G2]